MDVKITRRLNSHFLMRPFQQPPAFSPLFFPPLQHRHTHTSNPRPTPIISKLNDALLSLFVRRYFVFSLLYIYTRVCVVLGVESHPVTSPLPPHFRFSAYTYTYTLPSRGKNISARDSLLFFLLFSSRILCIVYL